MSLDAGHYFRVRHGITYQPGIGYRALRDWNSGASRQWLGPWRTSDVEAQADADVGSAMFRAFAALVGVLTWAQPNPDLGRWQRGDL